MCEPIRRSFSKDEMIDEAREFMVRADGIPKLLSPDDREDWRTNLGLLVEFCTGLFNAQEQERSEGRAESPDSVSCGEGAE
jgi:hypothetical protein